ncbi:hypothetical protein [Helicobacter pylori]|uniref:hypothetical protein n=1 Tax=Helicobacter pylori TaxID=210 RepID=UPI0012B3E243|nr:hypothetical protein [Helicobacter pylori]
MVSNTNDFGKVLDTVKDTFGNLLQLLTNLKNKKIEFYFHKKISNGLPFGIIFIASNSDNPIDIDNKTKKLESCFRDTIKHPFYCPFTIEDYLILDNLKSCFIFQNDRPFNLKQYLLGLKEKLGFELTSIFYCENANTHKIELIGNDSDFREVLLEFSENIPKAPNEIPQFLTNFKNSKIPNEKISFSPPKDYPSLYKVYGYFKREVRDTFDRYLWHGYSKIPQEKRIAEEIKINPPFCNYRVDSEQNRKINEIVEGLKSGKIIGKKIISNAFDLSVSYCFITLDGLKNLKERLFIDIINVINQKKRVALNHAQIDDIQYKEGVALDYALINDIKYNLLDNTFHFIFDIDLHLIDD